MRTYLRLISVAALVLVSRHPADAATRYVWSGSKSPGSGFTNWTTAAHTIQDALTVALAGETVWVTNDTYATGGVALPGYGLTNRVCITTAVAVVSVNGPAVTIIVGAPAPGGGNGNGAVRCAYVGTNATLSGFTLTNGHTRTEGGGFLEQGGGGALMETSGVLSNCVLTGNAANSYGGGVVRGKLFNCLLTRNSALEGGGARDATLINCTVVGNVADSVGGLYACAATNSIAYGNAAGADSNYNATCTFAFSCTAPDPGGNNASAPPVFVDPAGNDYRLQPGSSCIDTGTNQTWMIGALDLGGAPRRLNARVDMGAYEYYGDPLIDITNTDANVFGEMTPYAIGGTNNPYVVGLMTWTNATTGQAGNLASTSPWSVTGIALAFGANVISVQGWNPVGIPAADTVTVVRLTIHGGDSPSHYVATNGANIWPYTNWNTAALVIQDAVDTAGDGDTVWVTNGDYSVGGRLAGDDALTPNRVAVTRATTVRSVNGRAFTRIVGAAAAGGGNGAGAMRCAYLGVGAGLYDITLTNGHTHTSGSYRGGGGAWCEDTTAVISNCAITACSGVDWGGGARRGTLYDCTIVGCWASQGGAARESTLYRSLVAGCQASTGGGGVESCTLYDCVVSNNTATSYGGGAHGGTLTRCVLRDNRANDRGGGAERATLHNCIVRGNRSGYGGGACGGTIRGSSVFDNDASQFGGGIAGDGAGGNIYHCAVWGNRARQFGGGASEAMAYNSIFYDNTASSFANVYGTWTQSCYVEAALGGTHNLAAPQLADSMHLAEGSPCIRAGNAAYSSGVDIDADSWTNPPSIGCDEYRGANATGALSVAIRADYTNVAQGFGVSFTADIEGHASGHRWDFGDGTQVSNRPFIRSHVWTAPGVYPVALSVSNLTYPAGIAVTVTVTVVAQPVHYVDRYNGSPFPPFTNWVNAATSIQDAVSACLVPGSLVLVTNGLYDCGGATPDGLMNRVALTNAVIVQSVNGPDHTTIRAGGFPSGGRCAYLIAKSFLGGFTLTNGFSGWDAGGALCEPGAVMSNCVISVNRAYGIGGGVVGGTLYRCKLIGNQSDANYAGGSAYSTLLNCLMWGNVAGYAAGGVYRGELHNCTVYGNTAGNHAGAVEQSLLENSIVYGNSPAGFDQGCWWAYCCGTPSPGGEGSIEGPPLFVAPELGDFRLQPDSPCIDAGTNLLWMTAAADLAGHTRILNDRVDMGAYEYSGAPFVDITNAPVKAFGEVTNLVLRGTNNAFVTGLMWWTNTATVQGGTFPAITPWSTPTIGLAWGANWISVYGQNPDGVVTSDTVVIVRLREHGGNSTMHYVSTNSANQWPYTNWSGAARTIQDALNAAMDGDAVLATNGVYAAGGTIVTGSLSNRAAIAKAITLRSVNGPTHTFIVGAAAPGGGNGDGAVRCVYVGTNAVLCGFTLTNGHTRAAGDVDVVRERHGGGAWCEASGIISNCVFTDNSAFSRGGGVAYGSLCNCLLVRNTSDGGAGAYSATLRHCTIADNAAVNEGAGAALSTVHNSIVCDNTPDNLSGCTATYSCSPDLPGGAGNTNATPLFQDRPHGNYRLVTNSSCIDAGTSAEASATDLDGIPRPLDGNADGTNRVDMGAYELASASSDSDRDALDDAAELANRTDPLAPDTDHDDMLDGHEILASTDPLNPQSFLGMLALSNTVSGTQQVNVARWWSVDGRHYTLKRATNLVTDMSGFTVRSNIPGVGPINVETDRPPVSLTPCFYYIRLE